MSDTTPLLTSPFIASLPQPPIRNAEEYLKAYIGYVYTAVGAIFSTPGLEYLYI